MNVLFALCVLTVVALSSAKPQGHSRGCIYILGTCSKECEEGTHGYTTACSYLTPEATCENPTPKEDRRGKICDYSACYCDPPTVRDIVCGKCVALHKCPAKKTDSYGG